MATTAPDLTPERIEAFGAELDQIRAEVVADRGAADARYIHTVITVQRGLEAGGRAVLAVSLLPPAWLAGTGMLATAKILENMELGHNILHGQWDWMGDPAVHSTTWEWDFPSPAEAWKHTHNHLHHTYTNVAGRDRDLGYTILRMSPDQRWHPAHLLQPLYAALLAPVFEWGIALYDLEVDAAVAGQKSARRLVTDAAGLARKALRQFAKDYVFFPLLAGPSAVPCLLANLTANTLRNIWAHTVIFCGHFPGDVRTFTEEQIEDESRGEWYLRQIQGSANLQGSPSSTSSAATSATRSSTTSSPTCPATVTPRSPTGCARPARRTESRTSPARCTGSTPPPGAASCATRSPRAPYRSISQAGPM